MATWNAPLPDTALEGELTHIEDHNKIVAAIDEARDNVDGIDTRLADVEANGGGGSVDLDGYATEVYVDAAVAAIPDPTLAELPAGMVFAIMWNGSAWTLGGTVISARPTGRADLTMHAYGGTVAPAFAVAGDLWTEDAG